MAQQISTNTFGVAKWVVSPDATQGTHTTIQAAINAASSGDNIFVRPGTYTENLTLKAGVNLTGLRGDGKTPTVTIIGNCTHNTTGTVSISDFKLQTNGSFCVSNTGTLVSIINILDCVISATNNTAISFSNSNAGAQINIVMTAIDLGTTGIALYSMSSPGNLSFRYCNTTNSGGSSTASASSAGTVTCLYTNLLSPISTSGTAVFNNTYSSIDTSAQNATCQSSTGSGTHTANYSSYSSGTASALSIGGTSTQTLSNATVTSSNVNAITGAGSGVLRYSLLRFSGSSAGINVPTITPFVAANLIGTTINVSTDSNVSTLNLGTGAAVKSVTVGSVNSTSATTIQSGSGALNVTATGGALTINSGVGALSISNDASATTLTIGTGAAVKTVTLGSTNGASITAIKSGSAGITLATSGNGTIGLTSGSGAISIGQGGGTGAVNIGNTTGNTQVTGSLTATTTLTASSGAITATSGDVVITSGNLTLPTTTSSIGQILMNGTRFITYYNGNTVVGSGSSNFTTTGTSNVFIGDGIAASLGASANSNAAIGSAAMHDATTAAGNVAIGFNALYACTTGNQFNTAIGYAALNAITTGTNNVVIGASSGTSQATSDSSNILIGASIAGTGGNSNRLIIGNGTGTGSGNINVATICGISGKTSTSGVAVLVNASNVLGTSTSSIRFKENVQDMGSQSSDIFKLRPVTFTYKVSKPHVDEEASKLRQFGLIAEEVEQVMPDQVNYNLDGNIESVRYLNFIPMLINEIQKLRKEVEELKRR